ncbi:hypothetical protein [Pseudoalteromonas espejiana]|uniref:Uncharacterized protein n=1 Tax=Pseudoalteromonas espejiana TaxID=28107 RepID=A0A510XTJ4_9GAMM|nr:hypothetical protein [Pseudoalteromonas espejiana]GEK54334.1 hypothetical protein PES01_11790 [Pseudoalteromonas espejiana]
MQNKLAMALGTLPRYLAFQLFFLTYVLSIFIHASEPSPKIYQTGMFFYLLPLMMAMVVTYFGYMTARSGSVSKTQYLQACGVFVLYGFIWHALFNAT